MEYKLVTAATTYPVSVADAKTYCRVSHSNHDTLIEGLIKSATQQFENRSNLAIMPQTWKLSLNQSEVVERIEIAKYPILGIVSVNYYDDDNTLQSLTNSQRDYISFINGRPCSLILDEVPEVYDRDNAMEITFLAGFDDVPSDIEDALKMTVYRMYNHPDDPVTDRFSFVDRVIRDHRSWQ